MNKIRTRFAPSPTGSLHIGGLRTALYAYALAKHNGGEFILRIEDTDQKREVPGSTAKIKELLTVFDVGWDEYFLQSERAKAGIYKKFAERLVAEGHAFYCQCKAKNAKTEGFSKILRDPCRDKGLTDGAIKLKVPDSETVKFTDFVLDKEISWETSTIADATLLKSDNFPTYHLAVVVDDSEMQISHVLRGHDWLPSTPIHLLVYKYLGFKLPLIGHLTDILDPEGGKLSKRKGSVSCEGLIKEGYLPAAIANFVILLGWAPKDNRELFSLAEFIKVFDEKGLQKTNPVFNREKLDWFNGQYIREMKSDVLISELIRLDDKWAKVDRTMLEKITPLVKERIGKLTDFETYAGFFFGKKKTDKKLFGPDYKKHFKSALEVIEAEEVWNKNSLDKKLMEVVKANNYKTGDFFMDLRVAITASRFTPPINDSILILGKDETIARIKEILK